MNSARLRRIAVLAALAIAPACTSGTDAGGPVVNVGPDLQTRAGDSVGLTVSIDDTRGAGAAPWSYTVQWGDGASSTGSTSTTPVSVAHTYAAAGTFTVRADATSGGRSGADSATVTVAPPIVIAGAGDIGECGQPWPAATAALLDAIPGTVYTLGDNAYPNGTATDFANCYDPSWGRHKSRTRPTAGNHDYNTAGAAGYFGYFGTAAGDPATGYYSYDLGDWHIIVLNSNVAMNAGSAQELWLRADLAAHPNRCTAAMWHHARFSSGSIHGSNTVSSPLWQALYDADADLVLVGHVHNYERFAAQTAAGVADNARGIRQFVAGTGGAGAYIFGTPIANSEVRSVNHGVLKLTLRARSYDWEFVPVAGVTFTDSGTQLCH